MHGKNTKGWGEGEIDGDGQRGWLWGTVQTHSTIWVNYLWSPLQPTHPFQNKAWDVSGLSGLYLHHRNTWTLKSFHCSQTSQYNLGDKSHYLWSALQPTHPFQNKAWDVSGLSAGPTSIIVTPGLWSLSTVVKPHSTIWVTNHTTCDPLSNPPTPSRTKPEMCLVYLLDLPPST